MIVSLFDRYANVHDLNAESIPCCNLDVKVLYFIFSPNFQQNHAIQLVLYKIVIEIVLKKFFYMKSNITLNS